MEAEIRSLRGLIEEVRELAQEVRDHQMRRRAANKRYIEKKKKKTQKVGTIPIPSRGVIDEKTLHAKGFESYFKKWARWMQEDVESDKPLFAHVFLERVVADWNRAFQQLAVSKSGGYFHLAIGPSVRLKVTDFELTGFSRKHTIPSREPDIVDFRDRKVWNWARLYLCPVLEQTSYLRDGKPRVKKFWETLALLGGGRFEVKVKRDIWDLHYDDSKMFTLLRAVWPDLQMLFKAFADGLRQR